MNTALDIDTSEVDSEYPKLIEYFELLENECKVAKFYWNFRLGKHKYSKKYLYGFDMTDDTRMLWTPISSGSIILDMGEFYDATMRHYINITTTSKDDIIRLVKTTNKICRNQSLKNIYCFYETIITDETFYEGLNRQLPDCLPIKGCNVIDLKTGITRPRTKADLFTYECKVSYTKNESSELNSILSKIACNDEEHLKYLQKIMGYSLTGNISARVYFILYGLGANGKTMILNLMNKILKEQYQAVSKCVFINNNSGKTGGTEVLQLKDCRLATFSETEANDSLNEAIIKMISGNDPITARGLYKDPVTFVPQCKLMLCTNFKPDFNGNDKANVDRVRLVPFNARFIENPVKQNEFKRIDSVDTYVQEHYMDEFFSWCVRGAIEYYKNSRFEPTGEILAMQNDYIKEQANITNFIEQTYDDGNETDCVIKADLKMRYESWCKESGSKPLKVSVLYTKFDEIYGKSFLCTRKPYYKKWVYKNIKTKPYEDDDDMAFD